MSLQSQNVVDCGYTDCKTTALSITEALTDGIIALSNMSFLCPCADSAPSSSSVKSKKRAATLSEESEAFRKCSADLMKEIQDPELLVWELYSSNVVSKKQVDDMSVAGLSVMQRKTRLLSGVGNQIAVDPAKFQNLLRVLREQPPLKEIVKKLEETYRSHLKVGDRGTGLKGLSQLTS